MKITVRLFAGLRERAGLSQLTLDLPTGATAQSARDALLQQHPNLADLAPRAAIAVNRSYSTDDAELHEGDEVALLPPVSGG